MVGQHQLPHTDDDTTDTFFGDLPPALAAEAHRNLRPQSATPMNTPNPLRTWPDVPTRALIARDDLFFPPHFLRQVTYDRLGQHPTEIPGGHFPMLGHPLPLADHLDPHHPTSP